MISALPIRGSIENNVTHAKAIAGAANRRINIAGIRVKTDFNVGHVSAIPTEIIMMGGTAFPAMSETCKTNSGNAIS